MSLNDQERQMMTETRDSVRNIYRILNGNGKEGLVSKVRFHAKMFTGLWTLFILLLAAFIGSLLGGCTRVTVGPFTYTQILQGTELEIVAVDENGQPITLKYSRNNKPTIMVVEKIPGMIMP